MERVSVEKGLTLNPDCTGDTNAGIPALSFPEGTVKRIRNICKLATLFVKFGISDRWMNALIEIDFDDETSRKLSMVRYYECVTDRMKEKGEAIFNDIISGMNLRF